MNGVRVVGASTVGLLEAGLNHPDSYGAQILTFDDHGQRIPVRCPRVCRGLGGHADRLAERVIFPGELVTVDGIRFLRHHVVVRSQLDPAAVGLDFDTSGCFGRARMDVDADRKLTRVAVVASRGEKARDRYRRGGDTRRSCSHHTHLDSSRNHSAYWSVTRSLRELSCRRRRSRQRREARSWCNHVSRMAASRCGPLALVR